MAKKYKSPIGWYGGKYYMVKNLLKFVPIHNIYVEVFGGAGHFLFAKEPSKIDVYNDLDKNLYNFFSVLRNPVEYEELIKMIELSPYSRAEFINCRDTWESEENKLEKIRKWYVALCQSFGGGFKTWSFSTSVSRRNMSQTVSRYLGKIENLEKIVERLKTIQIENYDYKKLFKIYDSEETFFYLDPPYVTDSRASTFGYFLEMTDIQHEELVNNLLTLKGKCLLSGYENKIYKKLENNGWNKTILGNYSKRSVNPITGNFPKAEEIIWYNYEVSNDKI